MANLREFDARAALCRQFAKLDPASRHVWLAEAERWAGLAQMISRSQADAASRRTNESRQVSGRTREKVAIHAP